MASAPRPVITCVGIAVADLVFSLEAPLVPGGKNLAAARRMVGGGPAANAAVTVALLGGVARLVTKLGDDATGDSILEELASFGVETTGTRRVPGVASPLSGVIVEPNGERTIVNHTDARLVDGNDTVTADELRGSAAVVVDVRWLAGAQAAIREAKTLGIPTVVDVDLTVGDVPADIVTAATHLVFARPALQRLAGTSDVDEALRTVARRTDAFVAVTLGGDGVRWVEDDSIGSLPAFDVDVVDTLGAGDVFHGAFALAIVDGRSITQAMRFASAASALKCRTAGGRAGIPRRTDLDQFLESRP